MEIDKAEDTDGYMLTLGDGVFIFFTDADVSDSSLISYLFIDGGMSGVLFGDQSEQFGELWEAISASGQTTSAD